MDGKGENEGRSRRSGSTRLPEPESLADYFRRRSLARLEKVKTKSRRCHRPFSRLNSPSLLHLRRFQRGGFLPCDCALDRRLHLLEGADFDLTHALARYAELGCQVLERHRLIRKSPRLEDA